jgi:hypothetical protein
MNNIANYYVLPLLKLNKTSFGGRDNFVNSYITQNEEIVVEVKDKTLVPEENFIDNSEYMGDFDYNGSTIIVFNQPSEYRADILKFVQGKYSEMSNKAKESIILYSGLPYNLVRKDLPLKPNGKYPVDTSRYILALSKNPALRKLVETEIGQSLPPNAELITKPDMNNFYPLPESN